MEAIKKEAKVTDLDEVRNSALEIDEAVQAIQFLVDDIDSKTRDVKNREYIGAQIFIAADLTQHINILQVILRDLARNASIILDETDR